MQTLHWTGHRRAAHHGGLYPSQEGGRSAVSYRNRRRLPCQACGLHGQYTGLECYLSEDGVTYWSLRFLCAMCRLMLLELVGKIDLRRARLPRPDRGQNQGAMDIKGTCHA